MEIKWNKSVSHHVSRYFEIFVGILPRDVVKCRYHERKRVARIGEAAKFDDDE